MSFDARIAQSWQDNADAWVDAVRANRIPSRRAGTDAAVVEAVLSCGARRVLDAGCGEGWLARALTERGLAVTGFDGSNELIARALEAGGAHFLQLDYDAFIDNPRAAGEKFDAVVFNFSLFSEDIVPVLRAAGSALRSGGMLIIQTVHPFNDAQDSVYEDGWREETFATMSPAFRTAMPWYFRTMQSWLGTIVAAGFQVVGVREPLNRESGRPLSLIMLAQAA